MRKSGFYTRDVYGILQHPGVLCGCMCTCAFFVLSCILRHPLTPYELIMLPEYLLGISLSLSMDLVQFVLEITLGIVQFHVKHTHTDTDTDWKQIGIKMKWCLSNCFPALGIFSPDNSFLRSDVGRALGQKEKLDANFRKIWGVQTEARLSLLSSVPLRHRSASAHGTGATAAHQRA